VSWGVIMHVPEMEKALSELARVLKPGGTLVLCENNLHSPDVAIRERAVRIAKSMVRRPQSEIRKTERGTEAWSKSGSGGLMVRKTDFGFLTRFLASKHLVQYLRTAGQLTELYTNLPSKRLKRLVYAINLLYYKHIGLPSLAMGNVIYFRKETKAN